MVSKHKKVELETTAGKIVLEIYTGEMPLTAGNFVKLVEEGYYDGVIFPRVIAAF
ncbi:MAG: peptidylprolyl isomerase, partial [Nanoarchaeota archaeon]